ncbi:Predicted secretion system X protein GspD-like [hydrothermal vent metagenome]|uniref:Predicted secretion system X protein GspD-like n=1 Tax=hydrothermal vent metagenome TaxID=652676 RepID=A0A3B0QZ14_9ZZZZ
MNKLACKTAWFFARSKTGYSQSKTGYSKSGLTFLMLILFLVLAGCASIYSQKKGDEYIAAGKWDEAVHEYQGLYSEHPKKMEYKVRFEMAREKAVWLHYNRGKAALESGDYRAALVEFQRALTLNPNFSTAVSSIRKTRRIMDSAFYYRKGQDFLDAGNYRRAKNSFKRAVALDKDNELATIELEKLKNKQRVLMGGFELSLKSNAPISMEFKGAGVKRVFQVLSRLSGVNFVFDSNVKDSRTTIFLTTATFQQALELVLTTNNLSKKVVAENTIIIYPSTRRKRAQYEEMMIKVFYLTHSDAKKAVGMLKSMLKVTDISVNEKLNAIIVRAKPETITLAQRVLDATDLADAEVMLDVSIMEVKRNKTSNFGFDLAPDTATAAVPVTSGTIAMKALGKISTSDLLIGLPSATLNIKREDLDADILSNPRIRVKNNSKAKIHVGDRIPIITTTVNQGVSTENIQYEDVGLQLTVEPVIRPDDEIDLKLSLEVSSLGTKTVTTNGSVVYEIGTRKTETLLRLHDGETQIIGGLISDEERSTVTKVPFIGEIPIIGRIFANTDKSTVKTEILLSITPHILRRLEVPGARATSFMSGPKDAPASSTGAGQFSPMDSLRSNTPPEPINESELPPPFIPHDMPPIPQLPEPEE